MSEQPQILFADDNAVLKKVVRLKLESAGLRVITAGDGLEALQALQLNGIDLIISDYHMPGVNGEQLLATLRSDSRYADLPIILVTGKGYEIDTQRIREDYGVAAVLYKPLSPNELLKAVGRVLGSSATQLGLPGRDSSSNLIIG